MLLSKSDSICGLLNSQFWLTHHVCNFWSHTVIPPKYHSIHGDPCGSTSNDQQWSRTTSYHLGHTCFDWKQGIPQKVRWFGTSIPPLLIQTCKLCHTINFISGWYSKYIHMSHIINHTMVGWCWMYTQISNWHSFHRFLGPMTCQAPTRRVASTLTGSAGTAGTAGTAARDRRQPLM